MPDAVVQLEYPAAIPVDKKGVITKRVLRYDIVTMFVHAYEITAVESMLKTFAMTARISIFPSDVGARVVTPPTTIAVTPALLARSSFAITARISTFPSDVGVRVVTPPTVNKIIVEQIITGYRVT